MRNITNEYAVLTVEDYIHSIIEMAEVPPCCDYDFKEFSCEIWTASEMLKHLKENSHVPPLIIMENFQEKMKEFSKMNSHTGDMFSTAYNTATDIIDWVTSGF